MTRCTRTYISTVIARIMSEVEDRKRKKSADLPEDAVQQQQQEQEDGEEDVIGPLPDVPSAKKRKGLCVVRVQIMCMWINYAFNSSAVREGVFGEPSEC